MALNNRLLGLSLAFGGAGLGGLCLYIYRWLLHHQEPDIPETENSKSNVVIDETPEEESDEVFYPAYQYLDLRGRPIDDVAYQVLRGTQEMTVWRNEPPATENSQESSSTADPDPPAARDNLQIFNSQFPPRNRPVPSHSAPGPASDQPDPCRLVTTSDPVTRPEFRETARTRPLSDATFVDTESRVPPLGFWQRQAERGRGRLRAMFERFCDRVREAEERKTPRRERIRRIMSEIRQRSSFQQLSECPVPRCFKCGQKSDPEQSDSEESEDEEP